MEVRLYINFFVVYIGLLNNNKFAFIRTINQLAVTLINARTQYHCTANTIIMSIYFFSQSAN